MLRDLARRYVWWLPPEEALERPALVLCQLMQLGTYEDVAAAVEVVGEDGLRDALLHAPPGVLDPRSWTYWHLRLFRRPPPRLPERPLPS